MSIIPWKIKESTFGVDWFGNREVMARWIPLLLNHYHYLDTVVQVKLVLFIALWRSWQPPVSDRFFRGIPLWFGNFSLSTLFYQHSFKYRLYVVESRYWWPYYDEDLAFAGCNLGLSPINRPIIFVMLLTARNRFTRLRPVAGWSDIYVMSQLTTYPYTMNVVTHEQVDCSLVQPHYHYPNEEDVYEGKIIFFGSELMVAQFQRLWFCLS